MSNDLKGTIMNKSKANNKYLTSYQRKIKNRIRTIWDWKPWKYKKIQTNQHFAVVYIKSVSLSKQLKHAKTSTVGPIWKKDDKTKLRNYGPVSMLNTVSKIYRRFLHKNLTNYINIFLLNLYGFIASLTSQSLYYFAWF